MASSREQTNGHSANANANANVKDWTPSSWRTKPIKQCPEYPDIAALHKATGELNRLPPIVHPHEIEKLKQNLRDVARGEAFLLQGGDCAELFDYCRQDAIESKIKLLLQMSLVLIWGADKRVVRIGRMAGQYAKPRSSPTEVVDGREVPSFRGDILNGYHLEERELDPQRLVK
jgi:3-deoxy-7-phosphoheptulonate synthase